MDNKQKIITLMLSIFFTLSVTVSIVLAEEKNADQTDVVVTNNKVESETGVYYTVKKGDTLWDLSKRFNDSAWSWPEMWRENKQLLNPHQIYPGQKLRLFRKADIENIKTIKKIAMEAEPEAIDTPETDEKNVESVETVEIEESAEPVHEKPAEIKLPSYKYTKIDQVGFMRKKELESQGYIFKVRGDDKIMIFKGDEVYIQETGSLPLTPGAKYFLFRTLSPKYIKKNIASKSKLFAKKVKKLLGIQHLITGTVVITGKISGYSVGKITDTYRPILIDDKLTPYEKRSPEITLTASVEGLSGKIISAEEQEVMIGEGNVAFINKGSNHGVMEGQLYNIYYPEEKNTSWLSKHKDLFIPIDFASFIVLRTEPTTSTVLITSSYKGVSPGDAFHYPQE